MVRGAATLSGLDSRGLTRRNVVRGTGALIVGFSLLPRRSLPAAQTPEVRPAPNLPGSLAQYPRLDAWIRIGADGSVTLFSGKVEFGQGIKTALLQVVAEELEVPFEHLQLVTADTARTPNEGYTSGSHSMQDSGTALRHAAAQVREILISEAAQRWNVPAEQLKAEFATVVSADGRRLSYGELVTDEILRAAAQPSSKLKDPAQFSVMNRSIPRVDIPAKVTGGAAFIQDLRLPGMLHARVVRPPSYGARLAAVDVAAAERMPGVVKVLRDGNFLGLIAEREFQAINAMRTLADAATWEETHVLPRQSELPVALASLPTQDFTILDRQAASPKHGRQFEAHYSRPYLAHASIGPSCAVAELQDGVMTVWTHAQGVYFTRQAIAEMLSLPLKKVRCIHTEGSGCYGHNGADDAAADAALLASVLPGRPIRVQWMRAQEHAWEPFGAAMFTRISASLDASGRIARWDYAVWSNTHSMRPGPAGALLAAQHMSRAFPVPQARPLPQPEGGGDRNAIPLYTIPSARVVHHFLPAMPLRVSALRSLGAHMNVFSIESFMDELALLAQSDPVEFRLAHLSDPRACDVVRAAAERFGWSTRNKRDSGHGSGFSFARYKNLGAYCAVALEAEVERHSGRIRVARVVAVVDTGQVVNPDGVRNQIEGAVLQSLSWALHESVGFDDTRITSVDWASYPILRFSSAPGSVDVHLIDRPGSPFLGCGEAGQGPTTAALANAVASATGKRLRDLPLTPARMKSALGV